MGEPGRIVAVSDPEHGVAQADVAGVLRNVSIALLQDSDDAVGPGDWVLVHMGFAMSKIDEREAEEIARFFDGLTQADAQS